MTTPHDDASPAALRARLDASRAALLDAVARLTEQDFAADLGGGETVGGVLAALAASERAAAAGAGDADADTRGTPLAPQAIHDLAGARFETLRRLDAVEGAGERDAAALAAIAEVAAREEAAAARIRARFAGE